MIRSFPHIVYSVPGGYSWEFLVGMCRPVLRILTLFETKRCHFPHPFSGLEVVTKRTIHVLLLTEIMSSLTNTSKHYRSSLENHTRFQTKMGKIYTLFQTKTAAHTYMAYITEYPPPPHPSAPRWCVCYLLAYLYSFFFATVVLPVTTV